MANKYLLLLLLTILFGCSIQEPEKTGKEGKVLPDFNIQLMNQHIFNTSGIDAGVPTVFLLFRTDCPFCKAEIEDILDNIDDLEYCKFYFISADTLPQIQKFVDSYNLNGYNNIVAARDTGYFIKKYFNSPGVPYTVILDKDRKIKAGYFGKITSKEIKKYSKS